MGHFIDITGEKFGRLTAIEHIKGCRGNPPKWKCICECGNITYVETNKLKSGHTTSCGCKLQEVKDSIANLNKTHGQSNTRLYQTWQNMRERCYSTKNKVYDYYGGRGIGVCDDWRYNFSSFYEWAMQNGYNDKLTIDRIDVNKGYSPDNCQWVTMKQQCRNKRNNLYLDYNGESISMAELAERTGMNYSTLQDRIRRGFNLEKSLSKTNYARKLITFKGKTMCISDWAKEVGVNSSTLSTRLKRGWSVERALTTPVHHQ